MEMRDFKLLRSHQNLNIVEVMSDIITFAHSIWDRLSVNETRFHANYGRFQLYEINAACKNDRYIGLNIPFREKTHLSFILEPLTGPNKLIHILRDYDYHNQCYITPFYVDLVEDTDLIIR
jgi:sensor histidine kinase regulating citrate/malate metabolism